MENRNDKEQVQIQELEPEQLEKVNGGIFNSKIIMPARDNPDQEHKQPNQQP